MSQFSYSFCLTLFHSLWQCALLLGLYTAILPLIKKQLPSFKRNILYGLLLTQFILSCISFFIYYTGSLSFYTDIIATGFSTALLQQPFIEKYAPAVISIYTSVIFLKSLFLAYNWYKFKKLCRSTMIKPSLDLKLFTLKTANGFGIQRKVSLWFSNAVSTPLTFGFLKPVILMPVALLNHLSIKEAESLIIHELTHIKNNDYLLNWLLVIAETLFFYNPFVRIIANRIKLEREKNCDVQVLNFQYPVISYAETLLKAARLKTNINFFPLAAVFKNKQLLQRISFFTGSNNLIFSKKNYRAVSLSVILSALLINLVIVVKVKGFKEKQKQAAVFSIPGRAFFPEREETKRDFPLPQEYTNPNAVAVSLKESKKNMAFAAVQMDNAIESMNEAVQATGAKVAELSAKQADLHFAVATANIHPVVNVQTEEREIIVTEENSGTPVAFTKAYKLQWKDGKWKKDLVYVIKESNCIKDSICVVKDSVVTYIPPMQ